MAKSLLPGFDPTLLLILNLLGTFVFGLSGGMAGVRAQLDLFGAVVLGVVVGITGGTIGDVLIGIPPTTFRDWRYLAVAGGAGLIAALTHATITRLQRPIDVLDAAGLALFCVTGAANALAHRLGVVDAIIIGAITGIGGGMLRDVLVGEIPVVLRGGLYAIPALIGAGIVVSAYHAGDHTIVFPIVGAAVCFGMRLAGLHYGLGLPSAADVAIPNVSHLRRRQTDMTSATAQDPQITNGPHPPGGPPPSTPATES
ncbi:trimeric intracellular cation channel family protein [Conexibacter sp. S30A1]|uniref:trimeric intracellular cation channel family protein n=1 Tax=Conexibacter sp. S30A1 TaxID=2937800 RepID=UPI00200D0EB8|nr:TRIC cation channel family protein [Conexibacter sp. S30A1]